MGRRWASCTPAEGTIRVSDRLRDVPDHVLDYVLLHELAHLLVPGHGPAFWRLLASYPRLERARGFLDGLAHAEGLAPGADDDPSTGPPRRPVEPAAGSAETRAARASDTSGASSARVPSGSASTGHHRTSCDSALTRAAAPAGATAT